MESMLKEIRAKFKLLVVFCLRIIHSLHTTTGAAAYKDDPILWAALLWIQSIHNLGMKEERDIYSTSKIFYNGEELCPNISSRI